MNEEEYIKKKIISGHKIHYANGTWWENLRSGYCKPAIPYKPLEPGISKPDFNKSYIGYNHRVIKLSDATGIWKPYMLRDEGMLNWSIENIKSSRRRNIKSGLRKNEIYRISDLTDYREQISGILKSTAVRNGHGHSAGYYDLEKTEWWDVIMRVSRYSEFWIAMQEGVLAAYVNIHIVGNRAIIDGVKSNAEMLSSNPTSAIIYSIILSLQERGNISELWYGGKSNRPSLDKFKEYFGFEVVDVPYKTYMLGGYLPFPKMLNRFIRRGGG